MAEEEFDATRAMIGKVFFADRNDGAEHQYRCKIHITGPLCGTVVMDLFCDAGDSAHSEGEMPVDVCNAIAHKLGEAVNEACRLIGASDGKIRLANGREAGEFADEFTGSKTKKKKRKSDNMKSFLKKMPREVKEQIRDLLKGIPEDEDGPLVLGIKDNGEVEKVDMNEMKDSFDQYLGPKASTVVNPDDPDFGKQIDELFADDEDED